MARVIVGMTTSLDGFVADQSGRVERLHPDLAALHRVAYMNALIAETGAVLIGRRAFASNRRSRRRQPPPGTGPFRWSVASASSNRSCVLGRRLFETGLEQIELEKIGVQDVGARTSLRLRVEKK